MESYRKMFAITDPFPTRMEVPNGFNSTYRGHIPRSVVLYTGAGILLSGLHEVTVQEGTRFEIKGATVGYLLTLMSVEPGDHLEFERHSNTDIIVIAYDRQGREKNLGRGRNTHSKVHYRIQIYSGFRNSFDLSTTFNPQFTTLGLNPIGLMTLLGHHWVTGAAQPPFWDGGYRLYGHTWESFHRRHGLRQGMILVFEQEAHGFNFNVFFYNEDGSEAAAISRKLDEFSTAEISFYRNPHDINFVGHELRLGTRFVERNWSLLTHGVRIVTAAGIFKMQYDRNAQHDYVITGDWNAIFQYFSAHNNTMFKFSISLDNKRIFSSGRCTIFVVAFKDSSNSQPVPETSIEVSGDPYCSSGEDSICTHNLH